MASSKTSYQGGPYVDVLTGQGRYERIHTPLVSKLYQYSSIHTSLSYSHLQVSIGGLQNLTTQCNSEDIR